MTETLPPRTEGQIGAPNPIEMFWDKNRRAILALLVVLCLALAGSYAWQYMQQAERDDRWSTFATAANFDEAYSVDGSTANTLRNPELDRMLVQFSPGWMPGPIGYAVRTNQELLTKLEDHLDNASTADLQRGREQLKGTVAEPLLIWIQANRAAVEHRYDEALAHLTELEQGFPSHFLTRPSPYPVQFRPPVEKEKKPGEAKPPEQKNPGKQPKPELVAPVTGKSPVALLREQIETEKSFRTENPRLFEAPEPDAQPTAVVTTSEGVFKIRFYSQAAPAAVESFLKLAREGWFDKMRVHEVKRKGTSSDPFAAGDRPSEFAFGLPASREDDRGKWVTTDKSTAILDFPDTSLSHFPYMVSFAPEADGKSSGERVWINSTDASRQYDGDRIVFGRVVEGQDVVDRITQTLFATTAEDERGEGKPRDNIEITSIVIEG